MISLESVLKLSYLQAMPTFSIDNTDTARTNPTTTSLNGWVVEWWIDKPEIKSHYKQKLKARSSSGGEWIMDENIFDLLWGSGTLDVAPINACTQMQVCGWYSLVVMLVAKRLAGVVAEVHLRKPSCAGNKACKQGNLPWPSNPGQTTKMSKTSKTRVLVAPQKGPMSSNYFRQECIPVGCVPPVHWPYPGGGGVSA